MRAQGSNIVGHAAVDGEKQSKDEFGDGDGIFTGAIGDENAARTGGFDVDGIDAGASAKDEGELGGGLDGGGVDFLAADDEDVERCDDAGEFFGFGGRHVSDFATEVFEVAEVGLGEFVSDENFHKMGLSNCLLVITPFRRACQLWRREGLIWLILFKG